MTGIKQRLGIIGGSIAGCATALLLDRAGWQVTVFERAGEELQERGAGINLFASDLNRYVEQDLLDADIPRCRVRRYDFRWRTPSEALNGKIAGTTDVDSYALHWGELYRNLRKRVPAACYRSDCEVTHLRQGHREAVVTLSDGSEQTFDLVVAADGYRSMGRQVLFNGQSAEYAGHVAWRGLLDESRFDCSELLNEAVVGVGLPVGLSVYYFVPGPGGDQVGGRLINWLVYQPVDAAELPAFLRDKNGQIATGSIAPGLIRESELTEFNIRLRNQLPERFADICALSEHTFLQAIFQAEVPSYAQGRICLAGDAGALASPTTTAGALKAIEDALTLQHALTSGDDIDAQLRTWAVERGNQGNTLSRLGRHRVQRMIMQHKDWGGMSSAEFGAWFQSANNLEPG